MEAKDRPLIIDGCAFSEEGPFRGCCAEVLASGVSGVVLTLAHCAEGFDATVRGVGALYRFADDPTHRVRIARSMDDVEAAQAAGEVALILAFQDPHPIGNSLDCLRVFYELGVRIVQLTYNKANDLGTGCTESRDRGLTDFGRRVVQEMNRLGMVVDLSHCSVQTALDALEESRSPVIFSHTGARALSDCPRNHTDEVFRRCARQGGVIGISPWGPLIWRRIQDEQPSLEDYLDHVAHVVSLVGIDAVGFGGDMTLDDCRDEAGTAVQTQLYPEVVAEYDRRVGTRYEVRHVRGFKGVREIGHVMEGLRNRGYAEKDLRKFLGENFRRVFRQVWQR